MACLRLCFILESYIKSRVCSSSSNETEFLDGKKKQFTVYMSLSGNFNNISADFKEETSFFPS